MEEEKQAFKLLGLESGYQVGFIGSPEWAAELGMAFPDMGVISQVDTNLYGELLSKFAEKSEILRRLCDKFRENVEEIEHDFIVVPTASDERDLYKMLVRGQPQQTGLANSYIIAGIFAHIQLPDLRDTRNPTPQDISKTLCCEQLLQKSRAGIKTLEGERSLVFAEYLWKEYHSYLQRLNVDCRDTEILKTPVFALSIEIFCREVLKKHEKYSDSDRSSLCLLREFWDSLYN